MLETDYQKRTRKTSRPSRLADLRTEKYSPSNIPAKL